MRLHNSCNKCDIRERALCSVLKNTAAHKLHRMSYRQQLTKGKIILSENIEPKRFAVVISGVVKLVCTKRDGRQQIVGLQFPGDFVGRPFGNLGQLQVETATDVSLCCFSREPFESLLQKRPELEHALLQRTYDELEAARQWMFTLGHLSARAKVAAFIQLVVERVHESTGITSICPDAETKYDLPLSRTEIAEFLGLTLETVSREIGRLRSESVIEVAGLRSLHIRDFDRLKALADC